MLRPTIASPRFSEICCILISAKPHETKQSEYLCKNLGVIVVRDRLYNGLGTLGRIARLSQCNQVQFGTFRPTLNDILRRFQNQRKLEAAKMRMEYDILRSSRTTIATQLHHQCGVGRGSNTTSGEVDDRKTFETRSLLEQVEGSLNILRICVELFFAHNASLSDLAHNRTLVTDRFDHIAGTGFTLRTNEGGTLRDATQGFTEIASSTNERYLERMLVDVVLFVGRS